jgi:hypothetical protein
VTPCACCRIREVIPPAAWHSLQPAALREAAVAVARGETDAGPAADLPPYVRSRLRLLLAEGLDKSVSDCWKLDAGTAGEPVV